MEEAEFLAIEEVLEALCTRLGAPELTEARFYTRRETPDGSESLLPPRERVAAEIEALERYVSLFDRRTHDAAIEKIDGVLRQSASADSPRPPSFPNGARVIAPGRAGEGMEIFDLRELPVLDEVRQALRSLANRLRES